MPLEVRAYLGQEPPRPGALKSQLADAPSPFVVPGIEFGIDLRSLFCYVS
jgi:hypothetical protein